MNQTALDEALLHLDFMNDVFVEMEQGEIDDSRKEILFYELTARLWAAIHLVESFRLGRPNKHLDVALLEARAYDPSNKCAFSNKLH